MISGILAFVSFTLSIIWSVVFLPLSCLGVRVNKLEGSKMKKFIKNVTHSSIWAGDEPDGWICGKIYCGYIQTIVGNRSETKILWLVSGKRFYERVVNQNDDDDCDIESGGNLGKTKGKITHWFREGPYWNLNYSSRQHKVSDKIPMASQIRAIEEIIRLFNEKTFSVVLLYGRHGGGKSMTSQFLCKELLKTKKNIHFCDTHVPFECGDSFDAFYNRISPTEMSPLVVVFEEIDIVLNAIHSQTIEQGKHIPIQIRNKTDWNNFLDRFDRELYPHVILVMTTNKDMSYFDGLDESYMRAGRVNVKVKFD